MILLKLSRISGTPQMWSQSQAFIRVFLELLQNLKAFKLGFNNFLVEFPRYLKKGPKNLQKVLQPVSDQAG